MIITTLASNGNDACSLAPPLRHARGGTHFPFRAMKRQGQTMMHVNLHQDLLYMYLQLPIEPMHAHCTDMVIILFK